MIPLGVMAAGRVPAAASWSPADLPNLAMWLDAADTSTITASAGKVSAWTDKSPTGSHVTQATANLQPTTGVNAWDGKNVLTFNGGQELAHPTALALGSGNLTVWTISPSSARIASPEGGLDVDRPK